MVPPNVVKQCKQARQKRGIVLYILQFFDKSSSWWVYKLPVARRLVLIESLRQFLPLERFKLLGEDMGASSARWTCDQWITDPFCCSV